ncbi:MAG: hypothetical protein QM704_24525 [Anaeromyxobacteraceae bacterium]
MTVRALVAAAILAAAGTASAQGYVAVDHRPSAAGLVLRDAVSGALVGAAVSGGVILYKMGIQDESGYDWGRTLAWGTVIGLGAGLVWGVVDATTGPTYSAGRPVVSLHATDGQSFTLDQRRRDQSRLQTFTVWQGRF